jgi:hypothetical protein
VARSAQIRLAQRAGRGIRARARTCGCSRQAARTACMPAEPPALPPPQQRPAPQLGPFKALIDHSLVAEQQAPPKHRHYATHRFPRLVPAYGYQGGSDQVRRDVQAQRQARHETLIPLSHAPGSRVECAFGPS